MKKVLVMLMSLVLIFSLVPVAFAVGSPVVDPDPTPSASTAPIAPPEPAPAPAVADSGTDAKGNVVPVTAEAVDKETLAAEQPKVAAAVDATQAKADEALAVLKSETATVQEKEAAVEDAVVTVGGKAALDALKAAVEASSEVSSIAELEPVKAESTSITFEGENVEIAIEMPEAFAAYELTENSVVCVELVKADGTVEIVTLKVVNGKLVGKFPTSGVTGNFWVGSSVTAPQTGTTHLEGYVVCGIVLCVAVLLYSVKRFKAA